MDAREVWRQWCRRLEAVGDAALADPLVGDGRDAADGLRALVRQVVYATQFELELGDRDRPLLLRFDDDVTKWGGPNADNKYLRAHLDPAGTYRLTTAVAGCRELLVSVVEGDMQLGEYAVHAEVSLADVEIGPDGTLEVTIGPDPAHPAVAAAAAARPANHLTTAPSSRLLSIRVYVVDWLVDAVPTFHLERLDVDPGPPPPLDVTTVAGRLDAAAGWIEASVPYWLRYVEGARDRFPVNAFIPPHHPPGGAVNITYGAGFWDLGPDEAWVVTVEAPDAFHWSVQTHTWPWFESGELAHRQTSLNDAQAHVDPDGRVRFVVAHDDPGVPNWVDTEGRRIGMLAYRWVRAVTEPTPEGLVVPRAEVLDHLPADHPRTDPVERRRGLAERRRGIERRFRR